MADTKNIKTNSEKLFELRERAYGNNTAVATYKDTCDMIKSEHRAHTVIATDTFVKVAANGSRS